MVEIKKLISYMLKYKSQYLWGFFLLLIVNLLAAYIPDQIRKIIDHGIIERKAVTDWVFLVSFLVLIMAIIRILSRQEIFGIGRQVEFDLKQKLFEHLVKLEPGFYLNRRSGELISIITNDIQSIRALAGFGMLNVANTLISFATILPLMFIAHVKLTWCFLSLIPVVIFFVVALSSNIKKFQDLVQIRLAEMSSFLEQNFSGIYIIKAFAQELFEFSRFDTYNQNLKADYLKLVTLRSFIGPVMRVIASLGFVLLLYFGGLGIENRTFSAGDFAAYSLYIQRLLWPIATLGWIITIIYRAQVSTRRIEEILSTKAQIIDRANAISKRTFDHEIFLGGNINKKIPKATVFAITGKVASGKTTLVSKMVRLLEPSDGEILLDNTDVKNIKLEDLRRLIVLIPQDSFMFPLSVEDNIRYASNISDEQVRHLASLVLMDKEIDVMPEGYASIVGEGGITLSGGQRQRLAIARALALEPEILILDDSFANLDSNTASQILDEILLIRKNKTTILISQQTMISEKADFNLEL
ncbi:MAG: ABC transporter ATP-binding protein/permease [Candidatus Caenarcaniphilales bacterium]|jgi:ATP-binding cassette subfamily B protein|nr:ABC transporter ATP-binding protein/permease [Candidatus Caenarcaniphilales bacterium]